MDTVLVTTAIKAEPLTVEETDDSCLFQYIEVVPLDRDTDGSCTTECVSGDCPAEVEQEDVAVVKNEPDNVCCTILVLFRHVSFMRPFLKHVDRINSKYAAEICGNH